jgi:hypothetical protein
VMMMLLCRDCPRNRKRVRFRWYRSYRQSALMGLYPMEEASKWSDPILSL